MEVILAKTAGFCMGVDMALKRLDGLLGEEGAGPIYILGPIIHNPQVLQRYAEQGVIMAESPEDVPDGAFVVIRAHGIPRQVEDGLKARNVSVRDATCPRVKKAQTLIARNTDDSAVLLLYGEADHPEVKGLVSYAGNGFFVFGSPEELAGYAMESGKRYVLAAQTTQDKQIFAQLTEEMSGDPALNVTVLNTICDATKLRQKEAMQLAREVDYMVVVGGYNSGNTRRLAQVVADQGTPCSHVETLEELDLGQLARYRKIGVTAGASTPRDIIESVLSALGEL